MSFGCPLTGSLLRAPLILVLKIINKIVQIVILLLSEINNYYYYIYIRSKT